MVEESIEQFHRYRTIIHPVTKREHHENRGSRKLRNVNEHAKQTLRPVWIIYRTIEWYNAMIKQTSRYIQFVLAAAWELYQDDIAWSWNSNVNQGSAASAETRSPRCHVFANRVYNFLTFEFTKQRWNSLAQHLVQSQMKFSFSLNSWRDLCVDNLITRDSRDLDFYHRCV